MKDLKQILIDIMGKTLSSHQFDNVNLYHLTSSFERNLWDESGIEVLIYEANPIQNTLDDDKLNEFYDRIREHYNDLKPRISILMETHDLIENTHEISFTWRSSMGDTLQMKQSDHSIYFIIFYSGQY